MKKFCRSQNGAISMFVMIAMLFFLVSMMGIYMISSKRAQAQTESVGIVQDKYYKEGEEQEKYSSKIAKSDEIIPIYTKEQLWSIGENKAIEIEGKVYDFSQTNLTKYELKNDIVINIEELEASSTLDDVGIIKHDYEIYYYYDGNYYVPATNGNVDLSINGNNYQCISNPTLGYVKDGLVLHYDAINNTGTGHSPSSATWKDLSGNGNDGILKQGKMNWEEKCYNFSTGSQEYFETKENLEFGTSDRTIEFVVSLGNTQLQNIFGMGNLAHNEMFDCLYYANGFNCHVYGNAAKEGINEEIITNNIYSNTWKYNNGNMSYRTNNAKKDNVQFLQLNTKSTKFFVGKGAYEAYNNNNPFKIYSIRIYNRVLSDAEIQQNYEIDKMRFEIK